MFLKTLSKNFIEVKFKYHKIHSKYMIHLLSNVWLCNYHLNPVFFFFNTSITCQNSLELVRSEFSLPLPAPNIH